MPSLKSFLGGLAVMAASTYAATDLGSADEMGPAAFMWPADRVWAASMDNTAPCGSVASAGNRSEFPMNPKRNSDFSILIDSDEFASANPGHTCVSVPDAADSVTAGDKATLQIKYIADFDSSDNQTFYACADVTYVELTNFDESVPCFNATTSDDDDSSSSSTSTSSSASSTSTSSSHSSKSSSGGLSKGAIAGIVVGSVGGVSIVALAAILVYRRKNKRLSTLRQQHTARGVKWTEQPPKNSQSSTGSVRMENLA
ncbi:hypothetical protein G7Z17_g4990 [Cylindrodendrum hubeiense]|uniref:Copper acquisition factor BIM1-like domain-containing protein n=1 Tax=Cylindrodendrum hubeiense TaxID=595255 RepID=A0A9P5HI16_9HYPO|nr:hypothetical protein G7Z17_g4990 [Cylindrodendrum hubeiense]